MLRVCANRAAARRRKDKGRCESRRPLHTQQTERGEARPRRNHIRSASAGKLSADASNAGKSATSAAVPSTETVHHQTHERHERRSRRAPRRLRGEANHSTRASRTTRDAELSKSRVAHGIHGRHGRNGEKLPGHKKAQSRTRRALNAEVAMKAARGNATVSALSASSVLRDLIGLDLCHPCQPWWNGLAGNCVCVATVPGRTKTKAVPRSGTAFAHTLTAGLSSAATPRGGFVA